MYLMLYSVSSWRFLVAANIMASFSLVLCIECKVVGEMDVPIVFGCLEEF